MTTVIKIDITRRENFFLNKKRLSSKKKVKVQICLTFMKLFFSIARLRHNLMMYLFEQLKTH